MGRALWIGQNRSRNAARQVRATSASIASRQSTAIIAASAKR